MGGASLPPGFRFHPTDEELVGYYLKRKTDGLEIELEVIPVIDLYKCDPWELPEKSFLPKRDMEWFFFCPRDKKYPNGSRTNRATKSGYWKATGKDRKVVCNQPSAIGYRKTLVFYRGRAPLGDRTDWVMHEYRLAEDDSQGSPVFQGPFALCRVIKKNEMKGSDYSHSDTTLGQIGTSSNNVGSLAAQTNDTLVISDDLMVQTSSVGNGSNYSTPATTPAASPYRNMPMPDYDYPTTYPSTRTYSNNAWIPPDMILDSSKEYGYQQQFEFQNTASLQNNYGQYEISPSTSNSNIREELDDFSRYGCMSPYSVHGSYVGYSGNEDIFYEGFESFNLPQSLGNPNPNPNSF